MDFLSCPPGSYQGLVKAFEARIFSRNFLLLSWSSCPPGSPRCLFLGLGSSYFEVEFPIVVMVVLSKQFTVLAQKQALGSAVAPMKNMFLPGTHSVSDREMPEVVCGPLQTFRSQRQEDS